MCVHPLVLYHSTSKVMLQCCTQQFWGRYCATLKLWVMLHAMLQAGHMMQHCAQQSCNMCTSLGTTVSLYFRNDAAMFHAAILGWTLQL